MKYIIDVEISDFNNALFRQEYTSKNEYNKGDVLQFESGRKAFPWEIVKKKKLLNGFKYKLG